MDNQPPLSEADVNRIADAIIAKLKNEQGFWQYIYGPEPKQWFPEPGFVPSYPYPNHLSNIYGAKQ